MQFQRQATDGPVCYVSAGRAHPVSMSQDQALDDAEWCLNRSPAQRSCSVSSPTRLLGAVSRRWVCHSKLGTCGGPSRAAQASRLSRSRECRMPSREMVGDESIATKSGDLSHPRPVAEVRPSSRSPQSSSTFCDAAFPLKPQVPPRLVCVPSVVLDSYPPIPGNLP